MKHFKLGNLLPNMKELRTVAATGAAVMGGWGVSAAGVYLVSGKGQVERLFDSIGLPTWDEGPWRFIGMQVLDTTVAFAGAGLLGYAFGSARIRNQALLGGMLRVIWHIAGYVMPDQGKAIFLQGPGEGRGTLGDWITRRELGAPPAMPGVGDFITQRAMATY